MTVSFNKKSIYPLKWKYYKTAIAIFYLFLTSLYSSPSHAKDSLIIGITPWEKPRQMYRMHKPLIHYLEKKLDIKISFSVAKDYADLEQKIHIKKVDIGIFPPVAYVKAKNDLPTLKYMLTVSTKNTATKEIKDFYRGIIITLKNSSFNNLEDLENKRFAFTDINSSSGYQYPIRLLQSHKIKPDQFFSNIYMLKKHPKVTEALVEGSIDAGATWDANLINSIKKHGDIFRVIAETPPIPYDAWAAGPHVADELITLIKDLLLAIPDNHPLLKEMHEYGYPYSGWTRRNDSFYNPTRAILGLPLEIEKDEKIIFGITPWKNANKLKIMYSSLMQYLTKKLGRKAVFRVANDYNELGERINSQAVDVGFFSPFAYVRAKNSFPDIVYLLTMQKKNKNDILRDHYKGVIACLKSSSLHNLKDLYNKRFGFTSYTSTSGYLYPTALLKNNGINPKNDFSQVFMLKKHDRLIAALTHGSIDAGATLDDELKDAKEKYGDIFRILAKTGPIPLDAVAAGSHLSVSDRETIKYILLNIPLEADLWKTMKKQGRFYNGFTERNDQHYNVIRELGNIKKP